jgi:hypothetical protein
VSSSQRISPSKATTWPVMFVAISALFIVSCEEALPPEPTPFPYSPQRSMQADTGTILIGEDCGSISLPCMVSGVRVTETLRRLQRSGLHALPFPAAA